jgi:hypothetical protein
MQVQEVEIFITPDGKISFEVRGVPGRQCLDLTSDLEDDLGGSILERIETSEMTGSEIEVRTDNKLFTRS